MAFTVNDVQDLTRILAPHPEWLAEVQKRHPDHVGRLRQAGYPIFAVMLS